MTGAPLQIAPAYRSPRLCKTWTSKRPEAFQANGAGEGAAAFVPTPLPHAGEGLQQTLETDHFRPSSIAVARLPVASSPLNSQKNAPPRFCALTYCIFSLISCGES